MKQRNIFLAIIILFVGILFAGVFLFSACDMKNQWMMDKYYESGDNREVLRYLKNNGDVNIEYKDDIGTRASLAGIALFRDKKGTDVFYMIFNNPDFDLKKELSRDYNMVHAAASSNEAEILREILRRMKNQQLSVKDINVKKYYPLTFAAAEGSMEAAKVLIFEYEFDVNGMQNSEADTPLHAAAWEGHRQMLEFLIESGADYTLRGVYNQTARKSVEELLKEVSDGWTPQKRADYEEILKLLPVPQEVSAE